RGPTPKIAPYRPKSPVRGFLVCGLPVSTIAEYCRFLKVEGKWMGEMGLRFPFPESCLHRSFHRLRCQVCVDHRGRYIGVTEYLLNDGRTHALHGEPRGRGVAQAVELEPLV